MSIQRTLQKCLDDWKEISRLDFCLLDLNSQPFCATCSRQLPSASRLEEFSESSALCMANTGSCLYKVHDREEFSYILIVWGSGDSVPTIGELAVYQIESLITAYAEKNDKNTLCRNSCWEIIRKWKPLTRQKNCVSAPPPAGRSFLWKPARRKTNTLLQR